MGGGIRKRRGLKLDAGLQVCSRKDPVWGRGGGSAVSSPEQEKPSLCLPDLGVDHTPGVLDREEPCKQLRALSPPGFLMGIGPK